MESVPTCDIGMLTCQLRGSQASGQDAHVFRMCLDWATGNSCSRHAFGIFVVRIHIRAASEVTNFTVTDIVPDLASYVSLIIIKFNNKLKQRHTLWNCNQQNFRFPSLRNLLYWCSAVHTVVCWQLPSDDSCCDISITSSVWCEKGQLWDAHCSLAKVIVQAPARHNWPPLHFYSVRPSIFVLAICDEISLTKRRLSIPHQQTFSSSILGTLLVLSNCFAATIPNVLGVLPISSLKRHLEFVYAQNKPAVLYLFIISWMFVNSHVHVFIFIWCTSKECMILG